MKWSGFPTVAAVATFLTLALAPGAAAQVASTPIWNGDFQTGDLTGWTSSGINGGFAAVTQQGTCFSANDTRGITLAGGLCARIRGNGTTSSIGILTSEPFVAGSSVTYRALSEYSTEFAVSASPNTVTFDVRLLDAAGSILQSGIVQTSYVRLAFDGCIGRPPQSVDGVFSQHAIDTSTYAGQLVRVQFCQNTNVSNRGFFTLVDDVEVIGATPSPAQGFTFLVSSAGNKVLQFDEAGSFVGAYVPPGAGGLNVPLDSTFGPDGALYLSNRDGESVLRELGASMVPFVGAGSGGLDNPHGLAFGPDGNLYVSSELDGPTTRGTRVLRYDGATGAFIDVFVSTGLNLPAGIVFGPDGNLYVVDTNNDAVNGGAVRRYDGTTGALIDTFAPGLTAPRGVTFGPDGDLYVAETNGDRVVRFDGATGAAMGVFASGGGLDFPYGLRFGPDGHLYVASSGTSQVLRYDGMTGAFLNVAASGNGLSTPTYVTFVPAPASCAAVEAQLATANATIAGLRGDLAAANATLSGLQSDLATANATIADLSGQLTTANGTITELTADLAEADATIADLQARLAACEGGDGQLQATIDSFVDRLFGFGTDELVAAAARDAARAEIDAAIAVVGSGDRRVRRAERSYAAGLQAMADGKHARAVREFREAFRIAHRIAS